MKPVTAIFTHLKTRYETARAACPHKHNPWDYEITDGWDSDASAGATLLRSADSLIGAPAQTAQDAILKISLVLTCYQDKPWLAARLQATIQALQAGDLAAAADSFQWFCWQEAALSPRSPVAYFVTWEALIVADIKRLGESAQQQLVLL
jgi:hypothetical protein